MKYHVTYFYLATGMEGIADTEDYGIIEANSEEDAIEYIVHSIEPWRLKYPKGNSYRTWGLSAKLIDKD